MVEALWAVYFVVPNLGNQRAGVVVLENGTVRGGDSAYYYVGNFQIKDGVLSTNVEITHFAGQPNNVFGALTKVNVQLTGKIEYQEFVLKGSSLQTNQPITVLFKRLAEISA